MNKKIILGLTIAFSLSYFLARIIIVGQATSYEAQEAEEMSTEAAPLENQRLENLSVLPEDMASAASRIDIASTNFDKTIQGYKQFRQKYADGDQSVMQYLSEHGQQPHIMVVACSDSRVDPALILQSAPGELFVVRNVANIVPPYEKKDLYHGTSAALEFGVRYLNINHLIILGHSQCGGIKTLINDDKIEGNDFITNWISIVKTEKNIKNPDKYAQLALKKSYQNCMTFPWIKQRIANNELTIHLWFFDIKSGQIFVYNKEKKAYKPLQT